MARDNMKTVRRVIWPLGKAPLRCLLLLISHLFLIYSFLATLGIPLCWEGKQKIVESY